MRRSLLLVLFAALLATPLTACNGTSHNKPAGNGGTATATCTIPQNNGGDHDADNNGGPDDGDGCDV